MANQFSVAKNPTSVYTCEVFERNKTNISEMLQNCSCYAMYKERTMLPCAVNKYNVYLKRFSYMLNVKEIEEDKKHTR